MSLVEKAKYTISSAFALIEIVNEGYVLVADKGYTDIKFKCPGGGIETNELPIEAVTREISEEIGLKIATENFKEFEIINISEKKSSHSIIFYTLKIQSSAKNLLNPGKEIRLIKVVDQRELETMICYKDVLTNHERVWTKLLST